MFSVVSNFRILNSYTISLRDLLVKVLMKLLRVTCRADRVVL